MTDQPKRDPDAIQFAIINRATQLNISAIALAQMSGVSPQHVECYLACRCGMGTHKAYKLLKALRLRIIPEERGKP